MSSTFILTLDTTAPTVAWGATTDPVDAGALFISEFILEEVGEVTEAWITDAGGQRADLSIHPDRVETVLPDDFYSGRATVSLRVVDDLLNEAVRSRQVGVISPYAPPVETTGPPMVPRPKPPPTVHRRTIATRSVAGGSSSTRVSTQVADSTTASARSTTVITSRPGVRQRYTSRPAPRPHPPSVAVARSNVGNIATTVTGTARGVAAVTSTVTKHDGPDDELAFATLLLGL